MYKTHTQQLADYIKKNLKKGYTLDSLRFSLITQGYTKISVENAIELANKQLGEEIPEMKEKPEIIYKVIEHPEITEQSSINKEEQFTDEDLQTTTKKSFWRNLFE